MNIFGFAGFSGSGKTTLIEQLIPRFVARALRVSLIKHAHHSFDIDRPGKDSYRHREAGASEVLISSGQRWVLMHELRGDAEPDLFAQIRALSPCDLVLVEGYKRAQIPKLEVIRSDSRHSMLWPQDDSIVAVASDAPVQTNLPLLDLNNATEVATFIIEYTGLNNAKGSAAA